MQARTALVTGGSGFIGEAICLKLAQSYNIIICYSNSKERANMVLEKCNQIGENEYQILKINSIKDITSSSKNIKEPDVIIHSAGFSDETNISLIKSKQFEEQFNVSTLMLHQLTKEFVPMMRNKKFGRIILISSVGSIEGGTRQAHYACSKAAANSYIRSLGKEYGKYGITANSLIVGLVDSPMIRKEIEDNSINEKLSRIPLGRCGKPEEIAHICSMLCDDLGEYVNCQSIHVDGGYIPT